MQEEVENPWAKIALTSACRYTLPIFKE